MKIIVVHYLRIYHDLDQWLYFQGKGHREYKKSLLLRCIHHFKSDRINNMDHMRISGTEPSSVILSQKSIFKSWKEISQMFQTSVSLHTTPK